MTANTQTNNYTLGRGSLYFEPFAPGTTTPAGGERFFGDCSVVDFTFKSTDLDHYQSTAGTKELDFSVPLQVDRTGTFSTENISTENLALFFLGISGPISVAGAAIVGETIPAVVQDRYYQLGETAANPSGNRGISTVTAPVVKNDASTPVTFVAGVDYIIEPTGGSLYIVPGGAISSGSTVTNLVIDYTTLAGSYDHVVSGNSPIEGKLRFRSANAAGVDRDAVVPHVRINPNASFALIGDKLTTLQFDMKILKKGGPGGEALYIDGRGLSA